MDDRQVLKRFISYYKPHKFMFSMDMLASFLMSGISMLYPILTRKIYSEFVKDRNVQLIIMCGIGLVLIYLVRMALRYFVNYWGHEIGVKMQAQMRADAFSHLQDLPFAFFDANETGEIMSRLTNDLFNVSEMAHHGPENVLISVVSIIGSFIYLLTINWLLALIIFACAPILFFISMMTRQRQRKAFAETRKDLAVINAALQSSVSGIRVTKAFNNKETEMARFEAGNEQFVKSRAYAYKTMAVYHSSTSFIIDLFNVVCIVGGGLLTVLSDVFTVEDYLAFAVSISLFTTPLTTLVGFVEQYQDGIAGFKRYLDIVNVEAETEAPDVVSDLKLNGDIRFDHVSFRYETGDEVLSDVSFEIQKGETIALVGESGGGKTTICHLLPGFYRPQEGKIYFDGHDAESISLSCLRDNIGIVQQDVFLFNGSIRDNILFGRPNASEEEVIDAAEKANIMEYVNSLPNGLDTEVGERGVRLSGGQKQRIAIARVFLKNPSILVLDEATSALDNTTEILIQEALNKLAEGRTSIIVAHRLSTIKNADRIFVINHGEIVEEGSHAALMARNGEYAKLYDQQFRVGEFKGN